MRALWTRGSEVWFCCTERRERQRVAALDLSWLLYESRAVAIC